MTGNPVIFEKQGAIVHIRLNRPQVHNALAPESIRALAAIWRNYELDRSLRVAIVSGIGESFCAGMDLKRTDPGFGERNRDGAEATDDFVAEPGEPRRVNYVPPPTLYKPIIAAIHGVALGGGLELALNCDIRIAAEGSRFGLPEVTRGLVPGSGALYWLPRVVGLGPAMELLLSGRIIGTDEAMALRLVNRVVDPADLLPAAETLAREIAANAPLAVQAAKETVWRAMGSGLAEGLNISECQIRVLRMTQDYEEGARAFAEKRAPRFEGK